MFFDSFPQGPARFPNVRTGAGGMWALILVDDSCLVGFGILVFGVAQGCPEGVGPFEVDLNPFSFAYFLELVCCLEDVRDHYGGSVVVVVGWITVGVGGVGDWCLVGMVELVLPLV